MKSSTRLCLALLFALLPTAAQAAETAQGDTTTFFVEALDSAAVVRGGSILATGAFPADVSHIRLRLRPLFTSRLEEGDSASLVATARIRERGRSFSFVVPYGAPLGRYEVYARFFRNGRLADSTEVPTRGGLFRVVTGEGVKVAQVVPVLSYPDRSPTFGFSILGEGFSHIPEENVLILEGGKVFPICGRDVPADSAGDRGCVVGEVRDGRMITFSRLLRSEFVSPVRMRVQVGDRISEGEPTLLMLSTVQRWTPALMGLAALVLLASLIALILEGRKLFTLAGWTELPQKLLIDSETETYSLSKFQFLFWTGGAIFGYVYLLTARSLIQGHFTLPDVPQNLPELIGISASTGVLAMGISNARGAKGAGEVRPRFADLFTSGGVVVADRLQFFIWTVVGVVAFVGLTIRSDPGAISVLPPIPDGLLYLMGVSSLGYLGGKAVRKPGPNITRVGTVRVEDGALTLRVHGVHLSQDATFRIDDHPVTLDARLNENGRPKLEVQDEHPGFAKVLTFVLPDPGMGWETTGHSLTITNPDGQRAVANLAATPPAGQAPPTQDPGGGGGGTPTPPAAPAPAPEPEPELQPA